MKEIWGRVRSVLISVLFLRRGFHRFPCCRVWFAFAPVVCLCWGGRLKPQLLFCIPASAASARCLFPAVPAARSPPRPPAASRCTPVSVGLNDICMHVLLSFGCTNIYFIRATALIWWNKVEIYQIGRGPAVVLHANLIFLIHILNCRDLKAGLNRTDYTYWGCVGAWIMLLNAYIKHLFSSD